MVDSVAEVHIGEVGRALESALITSGQHVKIVDQHLKAEHE
jgi:hypothetical protein